MKGQTEKVDLDRRAVLVGLAGASALLLGKGGGIARAQEIKGVKIKVLKEVGSLIPGFPKVQLVEAAFQPGAALPPDTMKNPMICECTLGSLEVTQDGKTFTAKKGHIWTCKVGTVEGAMNKGTTVAIMRMFFLLPA